MVSCVRDVHDYSDNKARLFESGIAPWLGTSRSIRKSV